MDNIIQFKRWHDLVSLSQCAHFLLLRLARMKVGGAIIQGFDINDVITIWTAFAKTWMEVATSPQTLLSVQAAPMIGQTECTRNQKKTR